jgi:hypothetical protein
MGEFQIMFLLIIDFFIRKGMQCDELRVRIHMNVVIVSLQCDILIDVFWWDRIQVPFIREQAGFVNPDFMIDQLIRTSDGFVWKRAKGVVVNYSCNRSGS